MYLPINQNIGKIFPKNPQRPQIRQIKSCRGRSGRFALCKLTLKMITLDKYKNWKFKRLHKYAGTPSSEHKSEASKMPKPRFINKSQRIARENKDKHMNFSREDLKIDDPEEGPLKPLVSRKTLDENRRKLYTSEVAKRSTKLQKDPIDYMRFKFIKNGVRKRPMTYKKTKRTSKRSHTTLRNLSNFTGRMKSKHPLMRHMRHPLRSSLDHLTFNQIKLERIKQERRIEQAQKRCMALKSNHDYIDNKVDFQIKTSFTSANSTKVGIRLGKEHNSLGNISEGNNIFEQDQTLEKDDKQDSEEIENNIQPEEPDHAQRVQNTSFSPSSQANNGFVKIQNGKIAPLKIRTKCAALLQYEKKRKRAQKIRAQSLAFDKISKKRSNQERKRKERKRKLVQSMEEKSKMIIEQKKKAKHDELKLNEWMTIQNELSALAKRNAQMAKITKMQQRLKKKIKTKQEQYSELIDHF
ncbi:unnamed protein product [Moneuplotes crassus]|uniref:Uncharacterized protein n=1 Tax=Euplotes crassus TaxID=5936 RepID=A0AAD1U7W0_EUPCR|nr:unnamed protein product [Moneuplotes crassus]